MKHLSLFCTMFLLLMPAAVAPASAQHNASILDVALATPDLSTLVAAVRAADPAIAQTLANPGQLTVFAPTNDAFDELFRLLGVTAEQALAQPALLTEILLYHVSQPTRDAARLSQLDGRAITTLLEGGALAITTPGAGQVRLNERVTVLQADVRASNGIVHVIDRVLLPNRLFLDLAANIPPFPNAPGAPTTMPIPQPSTQQGFIGVAHLSPTAPAVDIYINGSVAVGGLQFTQITNFIPVQAGTYQVAIAPAGTSLNQAVFGPAAVTVNGGQALTTAAIGDLNAGTFNVVVFENDLSPVPAGQARVAVLHAIEDAPPVTVTVNGQRLIRPISFVGAAPNNVNQGLAVVTITATTYRDLRVVPAESPDRTVLNLSGSTFEPGLYYLVAAVGTLAAPRVVTVTAAAQVQ